MSSRGHTLPHTSHLLHIYSLICNFLHCTRHWTHNKSSATFFNTNAKKYVSCNWIRPRAGMCFGLSVELWYTYYSSYVVQLRLMHQQHSESLNSSVKQQGNGGDCEEEEEDSSFHMLKKNLDNECIFAGFFKVLFTEPVGKINHCLREETLRLKPCAQLNSCSSRICYMFMRVPGCLYRACMHKLCTYMQLTCTYMLNLQVAKLSHQSCCSNVCHLISPEAPSAAEISVCRGTKQCWLRRGDMKT